MTLIPGTTFSDSPNFDKVDFLRAFLSRIATITAKDLAQNNSPEYLFQNTVEELGEYAAAKTVEAGRKNKKLTENALTESVDLVICALSLFYANGGTEEQLCQIGQKKLNKWADRL